MKIVAAAAIALTLVALVLSVLPGAAPQTCLVAGAPATIHTAPLGPVVGTLADATPVEIERVVDGPRGAAWALVRIPGESEAYFVRRRALMC